MSHYVDFNHALVDYILKAYDYIIAGAGAAGLSLAYRLASSSLKDSSVLLLDRDAKDSNDRTWCFWAAESGPFEHIVFKKWPALKFSEERGSYGGSLGSLEYKMIRGQDFYREVRQKLKAFTNFEFRQERIQGIEDTASGAVVRTDQEAYFAPVVFNSCLFPESVEKAVPPHFLWQHFAGWRIQTEEPMFKTDEGLLMDFRTPQYGSARFFYVLPLSEREALVEYTIFSSEKLQPGYYQQALATYLQQQWQLRPEAYRIAEHEAGAIPMTDQRMPARYGRHTINIGTMAGAVKPTTGYAFKNIQRQADQLIQQMEQGLPLNAQLKAPQRFRFYDRLLLNILQHFGEEGKTVFCRLFRYNRMSAILSFLEERTHLLQEVRIFATLPIITFLRAVGRVYLMPVVRKLWPESRASDWMPPRKAPLPLKENQKLL